MFTDKKNIYVLVNRISYAGGAEQIAIKSALYIRERGYPLTILCLSIEDTTLYNLIKKSGIKILTLKQHNYLEKGDSKNKIEKLWDQINDVYNPRVKNFIKSNIKQDSIVLAHKVRGFSPEIFKWLSYLNCKLIYTIHDYEFFNYNAKNLGDGYIAKLYYKIFRKRYLRYIDRILVPSNFLKSEIYKKYKIENIYVLHNFIEQQDSALRDLNREFEVGFFGRIEEIKGVKQLCAAADISKVKTIIVGQGTILNELKEKYANKKFLFTGNLSKEEVLCYMRMTKIVVIPSLWNETFGLVVAEAISSGCFVLVSELGALKEVLSFCPERGLVLSENEILDPKVLSDVIMRELRNVKNLDNSIEILTIDKYYKDLTAILDNV